MTRGSAYPLDNAQNLKRKQPCFMTL